MRLILLLCALLLLCCAAPLMGAELIYSFPLDSSPGWTMEGVWWFGTPSGGADPTSGHTGSYVYGTDYVWWQPAQYLTTTALDCSTSTNTVLRFWRWFGLYQYDQAAIQVSGDGSNWTTVWDNPGYPIFDNGWVQVEYDISAVADGDSSVWIRWQMGPTEDNSGAGWNIDDIEIWSGSPGPLPVYSWNLNLSPGWTMEGTWQFGQPTGVGGDPTSGHTGTNVYGYNLSGNYTDNMPAYSLTTTAIDCSSVTGATLVFWRWLGVEYGYYDSAKVWVSNDGANWTMLWQNPAGTYMMESSWQLCVYDISAIADGQATVYIRWVMGPTDISVTYGGWNIDDIQIWNGPPVSILAWTAYADMAPGQEHDNTLQALADKLGGGYLVQEFPTNGQTGGDGGLLAKALAGKQVFLAIEQENATPTQATTAGTEFASTLQSFVGNGGTLAACGDGWRVWSGEFLTATGLMNATSVASYPSGTLYVVEDWHPLVQGVGATMAAQDGTTSYTVGSETLSVVQDGSGDTTLAVRDYGAGAVVLLGSDFYSYDSDGAQLLANAVLYPRYARRVLLYDDTYKHSAAEALRRLGYPYTLASYADFDELLTTQPWDLVVVDNAMYYLGSVWLDQDGAYRSIAQYANAWGPCSLDTWVLDLHPEITSAFGGTVAGTIYAPIPSLYAWTATPLFDSPNAVPTTLGTWDDLGYIRVGHQLTTTTGTAYAGWTASAAADQAAILLDNGSNSLVNAFLWDERAQDADVTGGSYGNGDGVQDVVELIMNQIVLLSWQPYVDMSFTPTATIPGTTVYYTVRSGPEVTSFDWDCGEGILTGATPTHAYSEPGFYTVNATAYVPWGNGGRTSTRQMIVGFADAPPGYWACNYIVACYDNGIVQGYWDGYHPEETVTRAQMAVYVARGMAGGDAYVPPGPGTATFPDVPTDHWAFKYVEYAYANGIVVGYWDGYHPDEDVNRAQMAVYAARVRAGGDGGVPPGPGTATFPDVPTDYWAFKYVEYCYDQEIVAGYWDGYHPEELVNRGQMAVYMQRTFRLWIPYT